MEKLNETQALGILAASARDLTGSQVDFFGATRESICLLFSGYPDGMSRKERFAAVKERAGLVPQSAGYKATSELVKLYYQLGQDKIMASQGWQDARRLARLQKALTTPGEADKLTLLRDAQADAESRATEAERAVVSASKAGAGVDLIRRCLAMMSDADVASKVFEDAASRTVLHALAVAQGYVKPKVKVQVK